MRTTIVCKVNNSSVDSATKQIQTQWHAVCCCRDVSKFVLHLLQNDSYTCMTYKMGDEFQLQHEITFHQNIFMMRSSVKLQIYILYFTHTYIYDIHMNCIMFRNSTKKVFPNDFTTTVLNLCVTTQRIYVTDAI